LERPEYIPGSAKIKNDRSDSDSILSVASQNMGSAQLIPYLKYYFNKMFVLERPEYIPGSAKTKNDRSDSDSILAVASPNLGSAQLIPYLKYYFNKMFIG
jgi:hypothetical protein